MIHYLTAAAISALAFLAGLLAMGLAKNDRFDRLRVKLLSATAETERLRSRLSDYELALWRRDDEIDRLRRVVSGRVDAQVVAINRRRLRVVREPGGAA